VLGVAADRYLDVTASGEGANVLVREFRVCRASLQHAEGSWRSRAAAGMPPD
jgi:hypothetical protein